MIPVSYQHMSFSSLTPAAADAATEGKGIGIFQGPIGQAIASKLGPSEPPKPADKDSATAPADKAAAAPTDVKPAPEAPAPFENKGIGPFKGPLAQAVASKLGKGGDSTGSEAPAVPAAPAPAAAAAAA
eukprot:CAMPEP_0202899192 /NCGR_PEP_ID=MMETSP1392-20130828/7490_1 /ASSEMBLY_ACC=CAM_ASM_000868 /TAXON_ID=225041 /ORGANISM="Chlamydomonas chlamydogama, Strain SAG 11-48b" /LENGTH=128 /DNA_ID=CAMNT_0049585307 /DNA_START=92 /DNA_END=475 /DNA_ORIENTATION=+